MLRRSLLALALLLLPAGCGGDDESAERPKRARQQEGAPSQPAPPPDAGTEAGHGADPRRVTVPREDSSPPKATIVLEAANGTALAEASQPGRAAQGVAELNASRLSARATGRDLNAGVARVRISIKELIDCRRASDGARYQRPRVRYFPPPQIERIRANPGTPLVTEDSRRLLIALGERCGSGQAVGGTGELWAEATNGTGLEAVTPHVRFSWAR